MIITTPRLRLRCWKQSDRDAFAAMHADPAVMHDYGGPISRGESDVKLDRYTATYRQHGFCRWAVESREGAFLGYAGIMPSRPGHALGSHIEIGWRLMRNAWGYGYAMEGARAALDDAFIRVGLSEVVAYTAPDNLRSQAVMRWLQMKRDPSRDFMADYDSIKAWRGLVWAASRAAISQHCGRDARPSARRPAAPPPVLGAPASTALRQITPSGAPVRLQARSASAGPPSLPSAQARAKAPALGQRRRRGGRISAGGPPSPPRQR
jgi:RimJ/RimL family protein N-acetyltransferase